MEWVPDSSKLSIGPCCLCCCKHFSDLTQPQRWCSGLLVVYLWPQSLSAGVTVSFEIILPLHTRNFQSTPASAQPLRTRIHIIPRLATVTDVVLLKSHIVERRTVVCVIKIEYFYNICSHIYVRCDSKYWHSLCCAIAMRTERFGSVTIYMSALYCVTVIWSFSPPAMEWFCG